MAELMKNHDNADGDFLVIKEGCCGNTWRRQRIREVETVALLTGHQTKYQLSKDDYYITSSFAVRHDILHIPMPRNIGQNLSLIME